MVLNLRKTRLALLLFGLILLTAICWLAVKDSAPPPKGPNLSPIPVESREYGEFLPWKEVNVLFPKYAEVTIHDFESKKSFKAQRRGGQNHADVQPLTASDTAVMKALYNGRWSWKRRAVIVELKEGRKIAASMNGMPHGKGAIRGNNFNGHFCIHFRDGKTHGSRKVDLAHQMMIWKAANVIDKQLGLLSPDKAVEALVTALDQNAAGIAKRLVYPPEKAEPLLAPAARISDVRLNSMEHMASDRYQVGLSLLFEGSQQEIKKKMVWETVKKKGRWMIKAESLEGLCRDNVK